MEDTIETGRKQARRGWRTIGFMIAALVVVIGVLLFVDDGPPDDAWLLPAIKPEPVPRNPLAEFCETLDGNPVEGYYELLKPAKEFKNISTEDMIKFVGKHPLQIEAFDKLMRTDPTGWRWPGLVGNFNLISSTGYLTGCQAMILQVQKMRSELLVRTGKAGDACLEGMRPVRFSHTISAIEGTLIAWLVGMTCQRGSEVELQRAITALGLSGEILRRVQEELIPLEPELAQIRRVLPWEYLGFKNTLALAKSGGVRPESLVDGPVILGKLFLRQNRTLSNCLALTRPVYEAAGKDWGSLLRVAKERDRKVEAWEADWFRFHISPNVGGNILLASSSGTFSNIYAKACANTALHRQAVLMLALRRYELAEGSLPETLDALVPKYLSAVPLDPFDNAQMRWKPSTGALYSVGANFTDEHGSFSDPYKSDNKDVGMRYWWKPAAP